jgi:hypothetical protein
VTSRTLTQAELVAEATAAFGDDSWKWAFRCPRCGDVATPQDFRDAGADPNRIGQECIGRHLGALTNWPTKDAGRSLAPRGCDWAAYGLLRGPWLIELPNGKTAGSFPLAVPETKNGGVT